MASDIYSFGIVTIYFMLNDMVFDVTEELNSDDRVCWHILRRHLS